MNALPMLIHLSGPAGIGKTTIAQMYINDNPLALLISADDLVAYLGQWQLHEPAARKLAFALVQSMATTHLSSGQSVIVPHILDDVGQAEALEKIAQSCGASYVECVLYAPKDEAVRRMRARGTWGESGAPPLTDADTPIIENLYDTVQQLAAKRPNMVQIISIEGDSRDTYRRFKAALAEQAA